MMMMILMIVIMMMIETRMFTLSELDHYTNGGEPVVKLVNVLVYLRCFC